MNEQEELERRIYLKKQLITLTKGEVVKMQDDLIDYLIKEVKRLRALLGETPEAA